MRELKKGSGVLKGTPRRYFFTNVMYEWRRGWLRSAFYSLGPGVPVGGGGVKGKGAGHLRKGLVSRSHNQRSGEGRGGSAAYVPFFASRSAGRARNRIGRSFLIWKETEARAASRFEPSNFACFPSPPRSPFNRRMSAGRSERVLSMHAKEVPYRWTISWDTKRTVW